MTKAEIALIREKYVSVREDAFKTFREFYTDKSIPLDERWQVFVDYDCGENDIYIAHIKIGKVDYDDLFFSYASRHEIIDFRSKIDNYEPWDGDKRKYSEEDLIAIKEFLMENDCKGCEYDW